MKKLIFISAFCFLLCSVVSAQERTPREATAAEVTAGTKGFPAFITPRRLAGSGGGGGPDLVTSNALYHLTIHTNDYAWILYGGWNPDAEDEYGQLFVGYPLASPIDGALAHRSIKVSDTNNSTSIVFAGIAKYPVLTEMYLENQNGAGVRHGNITIGVDTNGTSFYASPGAFRVIDSGSSYPHRDIVRVDPTNYTILVSNFVATGSLAVTNIGGATNTASISGGGSSINGVGFTNRTIDVLRVSIPAGDTSHASTTYSDSVALDAVLPVANRSYAIRWVLFVDNTTAAEGIKLDMQNGTASVSSVRASLIGHDNSGLIINARVSALSTSTAAATLTGNGVVVVDATVTITTAGTVKVRVAKNSAGAGTISVRALSNVIVSAQ